MGSKLSVEEILAGLEKRAAALREKEAFHAQQEDHHREQRALHAAELQKVEASLEAFRTAASPAVELAAPVRDRAGSEEESLPGPGRLLVSRLVRMTALSPTLDQPFGPSAVATEVNRRYPKQLSRPVDIRAASDVLRRMAAEGWIRLDRPGKAFHEALYTRIHQG